MINSLAYQLLPILCFLFRTLMRIFPKAKVVLTVRETEKWYESVKNTIFQNVELSQGTTGTFIKLIGMSKVHNLVIRLSQQGPPITRYGNIFTIVG